MLHSLLSLIILTNPISESFKKNCIIAGINIPKKQKNYSYATLPGSTPEDRSKIYELFYAIGNHGKVSILLHHQERIRRLGKEIEHVHPLRLLGYLFSDKDLIRAMDNIYRDTFKWYNTIKPLKASIEDEIKMNNIHCHIKAFSKQIEVPSEKIAPFFKKRDWSGLLKFLIKHKNKELEQIQ